MIVNEDLVIRASRDKADPMPSDCWLPVCILLRVYTRLLAGHDTNQRAVRAPRWRFAWAAAAAARSFFPCFLGGYCVCRGGGAIGFKAYAAEAKKGVRRRPRLVGRRANAASAACGCDGC